MSNGQIQDVEFWPEPIVIDVTRPFWQDPVPFIGFPQSGAEALLQDAPEGAPFYQPQAPEEEPIVWPDPLVVDVVTGTPEPEHMAIPDLVTEDIVNWPETLIVDVVSSTPTPVPANLPEHLFGPPSVYVPPSPVPRTLPKTAPPLIQFEDVPHNGDYIDIPIFPREEDMPSFTVPGGIDWPSLGDIFGPININVPIPGFQAGPPPPAGIFTGACPPGRVLRRVSLGRDVCVKKPRMNVCNRSALSRATRRVKGFLTLSKSTEKTMRQSFAPLLRTPGRRAPARGGACGGCGARSRASCLC